MYDDGLDPDAPFDDDVWELYHVAEDPSETRDLADEEPERLAEIVDLWWDEAAHVPRAPARQPTLDAIMNPRPAPDPPARPVRVPARSARRFPRASR